MPRMTASSPLIGIDGWTSDPNTWTRTGATTFTVPGDQTATFTKGTRIKCTNTTLKFFVVVGSSFGAGVTTVTVTGGSDFSLAAAAITGNFYSYQESPQGYPTAFNWVPTWTGFGATPPTTAQAIFSVTGNIVRVRYALSALGVSNATTMTISNLPITIGVTTDFNQGVLGAQDNSVQLSPGARMALTGGGTVATFFSTPGGAAWTAANNKGIFSFDVSYTF